MKHMPLVIFTAAFGFAVSAAPAAHAFTMEGTTVTGSDGSAKYLDPDNKVSRFGNGDGKTTIQQGNTTFQFGGQSQSFDQRYNPNQMFNTNRPASDR